MNSQNYRTVVEEGNNFSENLITDGILIAELVAIIETKGAVYVLDKIDSGVLNDGLHSSPPRWALSR